MATRNLVILFDGTYNSVDKKDKDGNDLLSNVFKVKECMLFKKNENNLLPEVKYVTGVGTCYMNELFMTGATGTDIPDRMKRGYDILTDWLNDGKCNLEENKIFLFGFSRGAYTARIFAHLLAKFGAPKDKMQCDKTVDAFFAHDMPPEYPPAWRVKVVALCVWDTVKAACLADYEDEELPDIVENAYHAMSIDENRDKFKLTKFRGKRAVQRWFPGIHSDIGGGYKKEESDLSNISLIWMLARARECGLKFASSKIKELSCKCDGIMHDEMNFFWKTLGGGIGYRNIDDGNPLDGSAYQRKKILGVNYRPANNDDLPQTEDNVRNFSHILRKSPDTTTL